MDSLEYKVLHKLFPSLILCIEQSPNDIFVNLRPSGILAPGDVSFFQNPTNSKLDKAQRIVNVVLTQVQLNTRVYAQFIEAMRASGSWTESTVRKIEEEYKSFAVTTLPPQEDSEEIRNHEEKQNVCDPPKKSTKRSLSDQKSDLRISASDPKRPKWDGECSADMPRTNSEGDDKFDEVMQSLEVVDEQLDTECSGIRDQEEKQNVCDPQFMPPKILTKRPLSDQESDLRTSASDPKRPKWDGECGADMPKINLEDDEILNNIKRRFRVTDEQLDTECSDEDLEHFGRHLVGYTKYANALGLSQADIEEIDGDVRISYSTKEKFIAVLKKWKSMGILESSPATYHSLLKVAVKLDDGNAVQKLCTQIKRVIEIRDHEEKQNVCVPKKPTKRSLLDQNSASASDPKQPKWDGEYSTSMPRTNSEEDENRCPSPFTTTRDPTVDCEAQASSLSTSIESQDDYKNPPLIPHFDLISELTEAKKNDLKYRLNKDSRKIVLQFGILLSGTENSLRKQKFPLCEIKSFILSLKPFPYDLAVNILDEEDKSKIENANNVSDIFGILRHKYVSFFNYHIIENIIEHFGTDEDQRRLQTYLEHFQIFCARSIFEVSPALFSSGSTTRETAKSLVFKFLNGGKHTTLEDVKRVFDDISHLLHLKQSALKLCSVEEGCIELHFLISAAVADHIFPVSPPQLSALSEIGVRVLSCEGVEQISREETEPRNEFHSCSSDHTHSIQHVETQNDEKLNNITRHFGVVDEQLDTECSDEDLEHFGRNLVGYIKYAHALGLSQADIMEIDVDMEIADDIKLKLTAALKKWKSVCKFISSLATYRSLLRVAIKLEDGEGAEEICKKIKHNVVSYNKSTSSGKV